MAPSPIEAVDLIRFAGLTLERLGTAAAELSKQAGHDREKAWLDAAAATLADALAPTRGLVDRARVLPELADLREEFAGVMQNAWVDALEKLLAGITFHVSGRAPIIEALFPHQKFPALRKAPREVLEKYQRDFEKRRKSGYVTRMLATDDFAFAPPVLDAIGEAWNGYQSCFGDTEIPAEEAEAIRAALAHGAAGLELALRQARLLAEAALAPFEGMFEASQLGQKMKRRTRPTVAAQQTDTVPAAPEEATQAAPAHEPAVTGEATDASPPPEDAPQPEPEPAEMPAPQAAASPRRTRRKVSS